MNPRFIGAPALETNHPFHFKLLPSMLSGPKCNHDLGVPLRLLKASDFADDSEESFDEAADSGMLEAMGDHDFYCAS